VSRSEVGSGMGWLDLLDGSEEGGDVLSRGGGVSTGDEEEVGGNVLHLD